MEEGFSIPELELLVYLIIIGAILFLCYYLSKFVAKKMGTGISGNNIKIIERVAFSQDKCLAICKICDRYYLVGVASQNIKILAELDPSNFQQNDAGVVKKTSFIEMFMKAKKNSDDNSENKT